MQRQMSSDEGGREGTQGMIGGWNMVTVVWSYRLFAFQLHLSRINAEGHSLDIMFCGEGESRGGKMMEGEGGITMTI